MPCSKALPRGGCALAQAGLLVKRPRCPLTLNRATPHLLAVRACVFTLFITPLTGAALMAGEARRSWLLAFAPKEAPPTMQKIKKVTRKAQRIGAPRTTTAVLLPYLCMWCLSLLERTEVLNDTGHEQQQVFWPIDIFVFPLPRRREVCWRDAIKAIKMMKQRRP